MSQRLNPERYAVHGKWREVARWAGYVTSPDGNDDRADIIVITADLLEKRSGHVWSDGAYKVTLKNVPDMRTKTFHGETAWSDAARYASDAATKCGDWRWRPDL
jgi:hypothetical protein